MQTQTNSCKLTADTKQLQHYNSSTKTLLTDMKQQMSCVLDDSNNLT